MTSPPSTRSWPSSCVSADPGVQAPVRGDAHLLQREVRLRGVDAALGDAWLSRQLDERGERRSVRGSVVLAHDDADAMFLYERVDVAHAGPGDDGKPGSQVLADLRRRRRDLRRRRED